MAFVFLLVPVFLLALLLSMAAFEDRYVTATAGRDEARRSAQPPAVDKSTADVCALEPDVGRDQRSVRRRGARRHLHAPRSWA